MSTVHFIVPDAFDDPRRPSGGNVYDRRLCEGLKTLGLAVRMHRVPGLWPRTRSGAGRIGPGAAALNGGTRRGERALAQVLAAIPAGEVVLVDGLVGSDVPEVLRPESARLRLVMLVHLPFGSIEPAGSADDGGQLVAGARPNEDGQVQVGERLAEGEQRDQTVRSRERAALQCCVAVVTTSHWSRRWLLGQYSLDPGAVVVVEPGVDPAEPAPGTPTGGRLLCVGAVTPLKGHDILVAALAEVRDLDWICTCVGSTAIDPDFAGSVAESARLAGIAQRVRFRGPSPRARLDAEFAAADLLVLPSRWETYGMVVTEALARGLPVIARNVGGVSEALTGRATDEGALGGRLPGVLVAPDDPVALAGELRRWLTDAGRRSELRRRALERRAELHGWGRTAAQVARVLEAISAVPA